MILMLDKFFFIHWLSMVIIECFKYRFSFYFHFHSHYSNHQIIKLVNQFLLNISHAPKK